MYIKIPAGHVLFLGGHRRWMPTFVLWFTEQPSFEIRHPRFHLKLISGRLKMTTERWLALVIPLWIMAICLALLTFWSH